MQDSEFCLDHDLTKFFQELVTETLEGRAHRPAPPIEQYLVGLLEASATSKGDGFVASTLRGPLAVQLSEALHAPATERFERLVRLGDGILVVGGLFEPHVQRFGLDEKYVATLGARAYSAASHLLAPVADSQRSGVDVLGYMAADFGRLLSLLRDVADTLLARSARSATDWARLCEKWIKKRSVHLERLLRAQGITLNHVDSLLI